LQTPSCEISIGIVVTLVVVVVIFKRAIPIVVLVVVLVPAVVVVLPRLSSRSHHHHRRSQFHNVSTLSDFTTIRNNSDFANERHHLTRFLNHTGGGKGGKGGGGEDSAPKMTSYLRACVCTNEPKSKKESRDVCDD
tara:strand:- start:344 stop:751 length:408 start_codon:yes stop_codon:yes gene_type:complete